MPKWKPVKGCKICGGVGSYTNCFDQEFKCHCYRKTPAWRKHNKRKEIGMYKDDTILLFVILFQQGLDAIRYPNLAFSFCEQEGIEFDYGSHNQSVMRDKIIDYLIKKTRLLQNKGAE